MKKRWISCMLLISMSFSLLGGCGSRSEESEQEMYAESEENEEETSMAETEFSLFIDIADFPKEVWGEDAISREITKRTGVTMDVTKSTGYEQLSSLIEQETLPDLIYSEELGREKILCNDDICYSYTELMELYPEVEFYVSEDELKENTFFNGKAYTIKSGRLPVDYEGAWLAGKEEEYLHYRKDILDELELKEPTNMDELEVVLRKVKAAYPKMVPLIWEEGFEGFFANQMGVGSWWDYGFKDQEAGEVALWLEMDGIKEVYRKINSFAKKGFISAAATTYDREQIYELAGSGEVFACITSVDGAFNMQKEAQDQGEKAVEWKLMTTPFAGYRNVRSSSEGAGLYITRNCKDPEAAFRFVAWMRSEEGRRLSSWGIEGTDWNFDENGQSIRTEEWNKRMGENYNYQDYGVGVWNFGDCGEEKMFVDWDSAKKLGVYMEDNVRAQTNLAKYNELYPELTVTNLVAATRMRETYEVLLERMASMEAKVIYAESDVVFENAWKEMLEEAEKSGMKNLAQYATERVVKYREE